MRTRVHLLSLIIVFPVNWTALGTYEAFSEDSLDEDVYQSINQRYKISQMNINFISFCPQKKHGRELTQYK